jgi:hypothetical protein
MLRLVYSVSDMLRWTEPTAPLVGDKKGKKQINSLDGVREYAMKDATSAKLVWQG